MNHSPSFLRIPAGWWAFASIVLAAAAAYSGSFAGVFVFDDGPAIVENPTLRHAGHPGRILNPPGDEAGTVGGRPLVNLSLAVNYALGGLAPRGYHAFNLGVHIAAAIVLFATLRAFVSLLAAWAATLLWAVHPLNTEAVTYVVQRAESMMGLFFLLTLYCFIRHAQSREPGSGSRPGSGAVPGAGLKLGLGSTRRGYAAGCVVFCFCGMATKEVMVSAPLVVLLCDRAFFTGSFREAWRRRRGLHLALFSSWLLLAWLVAGTRGRGGSAGFGSTARVIPYALTQARAIVTYVRLAFRPAPLVFDYGTALVTSPRAVLPECLLLCILLAVTLWALLRHPRMGFLPATFFLVLAPTSSFLPIATEPMAEHRMYLPLACVLVAAVLAAERGLAAVAAVAAVPRVRPGPILGILAGIAALFLGVATAERNRVYGSETALWLDTIAKRPGNPRAHNDLGTALRARGDNAAAAVQFAEALRADPNYAPADYNLGVLLLDTGHPGEAVPHLEKALAAPRHQAELRLYLSEAKYEEAFHLGNALAAAGRYEESVEAFRKAVALAPAKPAPRNNLANALLCCGRIDDAIAEYRIVLLATPGDRTPLENLEQALRLHQARSAR